MPPEKREFILMVQLVAAAYYGKEFLKHLAPEHEYWIFGAGLVCAFIVFCLRPLQKLACIASTAFWTCAAFIVAGGVSGIVSGASILAAAVVLFFAYGINHAE